jgi:hypothetical protein
MLELRFAAPEFMLSGLQVGGVKRGSTCLEPA